MAAADPCLKCCEKNHNNGCPSSCVCWCSRDKTESDKAAEMWEF